MSDIPMRPCAHRISALQTWLRLTLAAFVLAVYTSIALASGIAVADEGPSGAGTEPGGTGATSQQSGSGSPTSHSPSNSTSNPTSNPTSNTAQDAGVGHPPNPPSGNSHPDPDTKGSGSVDASQRDDSKQPITGSSSTTSPKNTGTTETTGGPTASGPQPTGTTGAPPATLAGAGAPDPTPVNVDTTTPGTLPPAVPGDDPAAIDTADPNTAPTTPPPADDTHKSNRFSQLAGVPAPTNAGPVAAAAVAPKLRSVSPQGASGPASPNASVAAAAVPSDPAPAYQRDLGPPLAGTVSDAATIVVSAVHSIATSIAQAFGPNTFLGVPYLLATTVANAAAAVGRSLVGAPLTAPSGRFTVDYGLLDGLAFFNPTKPPAGANDDSIFVTAAHPLPIILINGTTATQGANWSVGAPVLANAGYKVFTFNYGNTTADPNVPIQAIADIRQSGLELAAEVQKVLDATGAPKVILIGHSQGGGILPEYYINNLGGAGKVSQLIGIAPSNHGTDFDGLTGLQSLPIFGSVFVGLANAIAPALFQQALGSSFQQDVYGMGDTREGVLYTTITSINDEIVTPYTQQALNGPNVTNILIQDRYPGVVIGHANIITSPQAYALVLEALASNPAANPLAFQNTVAA